MNLLYNSPHYYIVEYPAYNGYELIDKRLGVGTFLYGEAATKFRDSINSMIATDPTIDTVDEFLGNFDVLMKQPVRYH